jgi:hypothetical protein
MTPATLTTLDWYLSLSAVISTPTAIVLTAHYMSEVGNWTPRLVTPAWILAGLAWLFGLLAMTNM